MSTRGVRWTLLAVPLTGLLLLAGCAATADDPGESSGDATDTRAAAEVVVEGCRAAMGPDLILDTIGQDPAQDSKAAAAKFNEAVSIDPSWAEVRDAYDDFKVRGPGTTATELSAVVGRACGQASAAAPDSRSVEEPAARAAALMEQACHAAWGPDMRLDSTGIDSEQDPALAARNFALAAVADTQWVEVQEAYDVFKYLPVGPEAIDYGSVIVSGCNRALAMTDN